VVALGGYARRELCPSSDVDLLVLHARADRDDLADVVRRLCYPLWDAGLQVGYAVHTPGSAVRAAADRIETATALVDRRLVAGEHGLLDDLAGRVAAWQRRSAPRLLADLAAVQADRRARAGRRPGMLEPHLKDGAGGLRDLQGLRWAAAWLVGEANLDALVTAHYLGAGLRRDLGEAGRTLLAARCALHLVRGRRAGTEVDRLRLDLQDEAATRLGMADGDELLRAVGLATRTVARAADRTWPLLLEDARSGRRLRRPPPAPAAASAGDRADGPPLPPRGRPRRPGGGPDEGRRRNRGLRRSAPAAAPGPGAPGRAAGPGHDGAAPRTLPAGGADHDPLEAPGLAVLAGEVVLDPGASLADDPSLGLRAIAAAARLGVVLERHSAERLAREVAAAGTLPWDAAARAALLDVLAAGGAATGALADLDQTGLLVAHLPGWARVRGRPQRNPLHTYDLDTHLFQTVAELRELRRGTGREARVAAGLADPATLLLAALLHDIGKAWPGDHSVVGADLAADWVAHMGFPAPDRVARLVRHHLLLPIVATGRDLDDPAELAAVAGAVGDLATLDGLYLLSLADARATGPAAHSPWKDVLIAQLHRRTRPLLGAPPEEDGVDPRQVAAAARGAAPDDPAVAALLDVVPDDYLVAGGVPQLLAHAALLAAVPRAAVRPGPAPGTTTVSVAAPDRVGLVADFAGVLAASGLDVLEARAFTVGDPRAGEERPAVATGLALGWYVVRPRGEVGADLAGVVADLGRAASGGLDVAAAVGARERRRDERPPPLAAPVPVEVTVEPRAGRTVLEVRAPDSPGLLYRLARALAADGADVAAARVETLGPQARDAFLVRGELDPPRRTALAAALRAAAGG